MFRKARIHLQWKLADLLPFLFPVQGSKRAGEVQVLCFHGICPDEIAYINARFYHESRFRALIKTLSETVHFLSLRAWLNGELDEERLNILLTFDDGYWNNKTHLLPLLEELEVPATLFVTAETAILWPDLFDVLVAENDIPEELLTYRSHWRRSNLQSVKREIAGFGAEEIRSLTKLLRVHFEQKERVTSPVLYKLLSDEDLHELHEHPLVSLANHSGNHYNLTNLTAETIREELQLVQQRLGRVGVPAIYGNVFAYPFGAYDRRTCELLESSGIVRQLITDTVDPEQKLIGRLVINPFLSVRNMVRAVHRGNY